MRQPRLDSGLNLSHVSGKSLSSHSICCLLARQRTLTPTIRQLTCWACTRRVDIRLPGKGIPNSNGARPVHQIIKMMTWIRTSRLSRTNLSLLGLWYKRVNFGAPDASVYTNHEPETQIIFHAGWYKRVNVGAELRCIGFCSTQLFRGTSLKRKRLALGPYGRLCLGLYDGPSGGAVSCERGTPVGSRVIKKSERRSGTRPGPSGVSKGYAQSLNPEPPNPAPETLNPSTLKAPTLETLTQVTMEEINSQFAACLWV